MVFYTTNVECVQKFFEHLFVRPLSRHVFGVLAYIVNLASEANPSTHAVNWHNKQYMKYDP